MPGLASVVIPTYNRAYIVGEAIRSVLAQTYKNVEVVVVDDGSTDNTEMLVRSYGPPVRYCYQPNRGVCAARNRGFAECRGEFIALLDSDDIWLPWKLEAQIATLNAFPKVGMVWTDMFAVDDRGAVLHNAYLRVRYHAHRKVDVGAVMSRVGTLSEYWIAAPPEARSAAVLAGDIFKYMFFGNLVHTSTVLLRRSRLDAIGGFDESLGRTGEDYEFHWRTTSAGDVALLDAPTIFHRIDAADQLSRLEVQIARNNIVTINKWLAKGGSRIDISTHDKKQHLAEAYDWLGEALLKTGARSEARPHLWRSYSLDRSRLRTLILFLSTLLPSCIVNLLRRAKRLLWPARYSRF